MDSSPNKVSFVTRFLNRCEGFLFRKDRQTDRLAKEDKPNKKIVTREIKPKNNTTQFVLTVIASVVMLGFFVQAVYLYSSTHEQIEKAATTINLTKTGQSMKVKFGQSPECSGAPCWVTPSFSDSDWYATKLPMNPSAGLKKIEGYADGLSSNSVFYRINIPVPESLARANEEISFTPFFVQHQFYEVYVNGRSVFTGNGTTSLGKIFNLPIRKADVQSGNVLIAIHASVKPDDLGIAHLRDSYLGIKSVLDAVYVFNERGLNSYFLLFMLSKGSIFIILGLFYLFTQGQRGLSYFLVFAFFTTFENLFIGSFISDWSIQQRTITYFSCKTFAVAGLLGFFVEFFQVHRVTMPLFRLGIFISLCVLGMAYDFGWGSRTVTLNNLWAVTNGWLVSSILAAMIMGGLSMRRWMREAPGVGRIKTMRNLLIFLGIYLGLTIWEFYFKSYGGFDKRPLYDLSFFYYLAFLTARDFGVKEGRILTLEGHMIEKERMSAELQEAAEIARVFIPKAPPAWTGFTIKAFHKSLTENSGDWYTFETAPSGKFYHFFMCDITGHGVQAAIITSTCKSVLSLSTNYRSELTESRDFALQYARALNGVLYENGAGQHIVTLLALTFDVENKKIYYLTAGHPTPFLVKSNRVLKPLISTNSLLGVHKEFKGGLECVDYDHGDQILTYTDGLPIRENIRAFKKLAGSPDVEVAPTQLIDAFVNNSDRSDTQGFDDDVSVVWFKAS